MRCALQAPGSTDKEYMAYRTDPQGDVFEIFKSAFDAAYNGNRAPVIINLHPTWFTPVHPLPTGPLPTGWLLVCPARPLHSGRHRLASSARL